MTTKNSNPYSILTETDKIDFNRWIDSCKDGDYEPLSNEEYVDIHKAMVESTTPEDIERAKAAEAEYYASIGEEVPFDDKIDDIERLNAAGWSKFEICKCAKAHEWGGHFKDGFYLCRECSADLTRKEREAEKKERNALDALVEAFRNSKEWI